LTEEGLGLFEDLAATGQDAMPVSGFRELTGIPRRTYCRRPTDPARRPGRQGAVVASDRSWRGGSKYAADRPEWGRRKIHTR